MQPIDRWDCVVRIQTERCESGSVVVEWVAGVAAAKWRPATGGWYWSAATYRVIHRPQSYHDSRIAVLLATSLSAQSHVELPNWLGGIGRFHAGVEFG